MRNVVNQQNFTHYPNVMRLINQSEKLFRDIQSMERFVNALFQAVLNLVPSVMPLQDEERLFIEAIRDLNYQASQLQSQERNGPDVAPSAALASLENSQTAITNSTISNSPSGGGVISNGAGGVGGTVGGTTVSGGQSGYESETVEDSHQDKKRKTSFNPYHGPSFITSIPDRDTPYISSMCIIDPSDRLDSATSLVIDAAMRLNHTHSAPLHSIVSWVNSPSKSKPPSRSTNNPAATRPAVSGGSANNSANNTPRVTGAKTLPTNGGAPLAR